MSKFLHFLPPLPRADFTQDELNEWTTEITKFKQKNWARSANLPKQSPEDLIQLINGLLSLFWQDCYENSDKISFAPYSPPQIEFRQDAKDKDRIILGIIYNALEAKEDMKRG